MDAIDMVYVIIDAKTGEPVVAFLDEADAADWVSEYPADTVKPVPIGAPTASIARTLDLLAADED